MGYPQETKRKPRVYLWATFRGPTGNPWERPGLPMGHPRMIYKKQYPIIANRTTTNGVKFKAYSLVEIKMLGSNKSKY